MAVLQPIFHITSSNYLGVGDGALPAVNFEANIIKMADNLKSNSSSNSTFEIYFRQFVIYVVKNPYEFLSYGKGPFSVVPYFVQIAAAVNCYFIVIFDI